MKKLLLLAVILAAIVVVAYGQEDQSPRQARKFDDGRTVRRIVRKRKQLPIDGIPRGGRPIKIRRKKPLISRRFYFFSCFLFIATINICSSSSRNEFRSFFSPRRASIPDIEKEVEGQEEESSHFASRCRSRSSYTRFFRQTHCSIQLFS